MGKEETLGNLTTIIKILIMTIAPSIAVYLGTDEQTITAFLTAVFAFILAVTDARYPNTFKIFDNAQTVPEETGVLNDEYITEDDDIA